MNCQRKKHAGWRLLVSTSTNPIVSTGFFFRNMSVAWDLAQDVKFRPLSDNLYILQFLCLGDWEWVMEEGPWTFKGKAMVIAPYDGFTRTSTVPLNNIDIWIQIHDLPDGFFSYIKLLAGTVGEFIYAEPKSQDFEGFSESI